MCSFANNTGAPTWIIQTKQAYLMMTNNNKKNHMTHELLTPRYQVVADYPNSPFNVGDVLVIEKRELHEFVRHGHLVTLHSTIQQYPHLFRLMNWWEQRPKGDMPEYVRWRKTGVISKCEWSGNVCVINGVKFPSLNTFTPATETEYLQA
jgi:hypothetical protein